MNKEKREEIERYIKEHATEYLERDKSGKGYICPICGSGSGSHGTGITENPKSKGHFTCWAGCFQNADIFEIIGKQFNLTDFNEIFIKACELFNISLDESYTRPSAETRKSMLKERREDYSMTENKNQNKGTESANFTEFYKQAAANIEMTDYHRGLGLETLKRFHVGFMPQWRVKENAPTSPRLIIPIDESCYLARDTRAELTETQAQYEKMRQGEISLFNAVALEQDKEPVFITEGEIDALSIIDAGGQAVALGGVANIGKLIAAVKEGKVKARLIISLDNDEAGRNAAEKLEEQLKQAGFFSYRHFSILEGYKDENELLTNNRKEFEEWVKAGKSLDFTASKEENQNEKEAREKFENESGASIINEFNNFIKNNQAGKSITTGFENLDYFLDGGLYPGLYVFGAISSLGKTTFIMQIADSIAKSGRGVLIFSLEMSRFELIAKTLSRLSFNRSHEKYGSDEHAKTTRGVLLGRWQNKKDFEIYAETVKDYSGWGSNIHITEGIGNIGVAEIRAKIEEFKKFRNETPVVIIDYLQILAPFDLKMTDKQNVDKNITELKRLSRDFEIPVLGISSFNRENYSAPVSMTSFKESGAIEYSSDVLIGLQYEGWDYEEGEAETMRLKRLRQLKKDLWQRAQDLSSQDIQLKILKNRNGVKGDLFFDFYPAFNCFEEKMRSN